MATVNAKLECRWDRWTGRRLYLRLTPARADGATVLDGMPMGRTPEEAHTNLAGLNDRRRALGLEEVRLAS